MTTIRNLSTRLLIALLLAAGLQGVRAGSATWNFSPATGDWNTATNWSLATVPNGPADTATFDFSNQTSISLSAMTEVRGIVFNPAASAYTIAIPDGTRLTLSGAGITNNAPAPETIANEGELIFAGNAKAGNTVLNNRGATTPLNASTTNFANLASADHATIVNRASERAASSGAQLFFYTKSTAGSASFTNEGGTESRAGGNTGFYDQSTAGDCVFTVNGGSGPSDIGSNGGNLFFAEKSTAGNAAIIVNAGSNDGDGGELTFIGTSTGGTASVQLFGNGHCDISGRGKPGVTIGSLEGDGFVELGGRTLSIGSNGVSTTFSGVLEDGGISGGKGGVVEKLGTGNFTLRGGSTYTGGTVVSAGALRVANITGSATGTGAVAINSGTLGGRGIISGATTINSGAFLAPAVGSSKQTTLTLQSALTMNTSATYTCTFKAKKNKARTDLVKANGVTLNGASINLVGQTQGTLNRGLTFTVLSNTSATPISGTFSNLPNGGIVSMNGNNLQASYSGGDGNDLTLTAVP